MTILVFTHRQIEAQCKHRPGGYRSQLMKSAVAQDEHGVTFDTTHPAWVALVRRYQQRPTPTIKKAASLARAVVAGKKVDEATLQQRLAICRACDLLRTDDQGDWCGACGCGLSSVNRQITNLAAYEENLPHWGCKHPRRKEGKGWPKASG